MNAKSKDNNRSSHPKKDLKDVECFTCHKKGHYANTCPMGSNPNKTPVGNLRHYVIKEQGKGNPLSKPSSKKGQGKNKDSTQSQD